MEKENIVGLACTMDELVESIKDFHKQYGKVAGTEITIRYGTDHNHINPKKVGVRVFVYRTKDKSVYRGSHTEYYHQDLIPAE